MGEGGDGGGGEGDENAAAATAAAAEVNVAAVVVAAAVAEHGSKRDAFGCCDPGLSPSVKTSGNKNLEHRHGLK